MKVGVVGVGNVGSATALSLLERGGMCRELVLVDRSMERANGVATDMRYATPLVPTVDVRAGDYDALTDAALVIITAGVNEEAGGATDRSDPQGRLRLLDTNAEVYADVVPRIMAVAPQAVLMVVTDPPDPLADLTRQLTGHDRVFSTGTLIDSLRFRVHLADRLRVRPRDVQAMVVGEHGTSEVLLWSSASVGGVSILEVLGRSGQPSTRSSRRSSAISATPTSPSSKAPGRASMASGRCRPGSPRRSCATSARSCRWPPIRHAMG